MGKLEIAVGLFCGLLLALPAVAEEEYYTWIDENGVVNYSERNPQGYNAQFVGRETRFGYDTQRSIFPPEPESESGINEDDEGPELETDEGFRQEMAQIEADKKRNAEIRRSNCRVARVNLEKLANYNRIRVEDENGQTRFLTDEEKQARIDAARQSVSENCN
ncbi:MAG: DUF4124 domain-containing protein [Pseudomonadales bacterium]|nr:DUF4124 domain-containing protein [Pseudomonadales bacterium]